MRLLQILQREQRPATPAEQAVLARWSGWGAVPAVFDDRREDYRWARQQLAALLSPAELAAARRNTLNAHYTDAELAEAVWGAAAALGFTGGRVLEPGCGSGNFIAFAPVGARLTGIELDPVTAGIAAALYPDADIRCESFADSRDADASYDLAIGNVPFGNMVLHDRRHNQAGHSIHNHFIVKALHLVRPGGLVMVLTSRYTMDARNPAARREIVGLADLAGAIRLPSGAHQRAAGTSVVTDLLILRRREPGRNPAHVAAWEQARVTELDGAPIPVNEYFLNNPQAVLGTMGTGRAAYRDADLVVRPGGDTAAALRAALETLTATARAADLTWTPPAPGRPGPAAVVLPSAEEDGFLSARDDGTFTQVVSGTERPYEVPRTQAAELRHLLRLRDAARALLHAESLSADDTADMAAMRAGLTRLYDSYAEAYGPLNRFTLRATGRTSPETGEPAMARIRPPQGGFDRDPYAPLVYALEEFDPVGQQAAKASIFRERVIAPRAPRLGADTPADALAICLDTCGEVRLGEIARLLGTSQVDARRQLGTLVFDDPESGRLVTAAEYLSGNVRDRLAVARQAAADDPRYAVNVAGLRAALPPDLAPGEISARLGAGWINARHVRDFLREILDDPRLDVEHPGGQVWAVRGSSHSILATSTWGTPRYPAPDLAQAILEQRKVEVHDTVRTPGGGTRSVLNVDATLAAQEKAAGLAARFSDWAWEDPARAARLARAYNDRFNNLVLRSYDDAQLSLPGLSVAFRPRPHQVAAVARMIHEPAVLLAHEVGAGKTAEMIMGVTELGRLGLVRKPAIVVPNHMLEQFTREWLQLYPQAKVLAVSKDQLRQDRRREFVARCATGTWDGVVITRSAFERIPLRPDAQREYMNQELERWRQWLDTARKAGGLSVKRLQGALLRAEERLKAKLDSAKDPGVTFEETGIDYLCVDEAHGYKNLRTPSNISDAAIDGSMRAADLDMKISYLRRRNGSRVVTFATATPIANSVTEAYVMQKYLRPDLLEKAGIEVFDTWAATFGQVVAQVELAPEGGGRFRTKARFARFANVPEMLKMLHVAADVKTTEDLNLPVPMLAPRAEDSKRIPEIITVEPTGELIAYVAELGDRAGKVRQGSVASTDDNMLKISGDGRRAALDLRMVSLPQTAPGKIAAAADQIAGIWRQHHNREYHAADGHPHPVRGALQLVFCDLGTPGPSWNAYEELRDELAGRGLPPESVRFIHEAKTDRDKGRLFAACRNGNVAVLIGSTEKMGVGTNVQDRAIALHHLDAPWRPADVAQREGRILRQGNLNPEVQIYRYVTARSFDGYMWQTLERKARFISQVMHARLDTRDITDIGDTALSFSEVKALATGNPLLIDKAEADAELTRLQRAERAHQRSQQSLRYTVTRLEQGIIDLTRQADDTDAAISRRQDTRGEKFTMTIGGIQHTRRADAGQDLAQALQREAAQLDGYRDHIVHLGRLGGFPVSAALQRSKDGKTAVTITLDGAPGASIDLKPSDLRGSEHGTLITRLEHRLARLDDHKASILADIQHAEREIAHARENLGQPYPQAEQLTIARGRARQINDQLEQMAAQQQADTEPAPAGQEPSSSPSALETSASERTGHAGADLSDARSGSSEAGFGKRDPQTAREAGDSSAGALGRGDQGQSADWRDQLMACAREQWTPRVPQPPGTAATLRPPEPEDPEDPEASELTAAMRAGWPLPETAAPASAEFPYRYITSMK